MAATCDYHASAERLGFCIHKPNAGLVEQFLDREDAEGMNIHDGPAATDGFGPDEVQELQGQAVQRSLHWAVTKAMPTADFGRFWGVCRDELAAAVVGDDGPERLQELVMVWVTRHATEA